MDRCELTAWLRLGLTPGLGLRRALRLLGAFGSPAAIFEQSAQALACLAPPTLVTALQVVPETLSSQVERTERWLAQARGPTLHRVVALGEPLYPASLLHLSDPPLMLFTQGAAPGATADFPPSVAVVGSRSPSPQGRGHARQFARELTEQGLCVVSGLALGVDGAAHEGALEGAQRTAGGWATVAVVGTGLDRVYPAAHRALAGRIATEGLLVSEFPLGTPPLQENFPRRNRLIAGLSQGTLVVEAALKSGSLITAQMALDLGREVMALPGSVQSPQSRGCHALLKQGAALVETASDVLEVLGWRSATPPQHTAVTGAATEVPPLLEVLGFDPTSFDALQARCGLSTDVLQTQLLALELDGALAHLPGGLFQRLV